MAPIKKMSIHMNPKPIDIIFDNLTYTVSYGKFNAERKTILKGVSGHFRSGELTAIMGPSGAGKSSLLNILTGFHEFGVGGCIKTTNQANKKKEGLDCKDSCYILQDDQLCPLFTVHEIMSITADLKLGPSVSKESKEYLIEGILTTIGLTRTKETRCGRLSGGQKKRLSIALELIDNPPVMFLDEPTTGLDSSSCTQTVATLRRLAKGGRTIVCTIHQPSASVFEMFDHVYVIADGLCVYQGSSFNIIPYLQTIGLHCPQYHNPADFVLEVVTGEYGHFSSQLVASANNPLWRTNTQCTKANTLVLPVEDFDEYSINNGIQKFSELYSAPSEIYRFFILARRCAVKLYRDWTVSHLKVALHFLVGIFIGVLYSECGVDASKSIYNVGFLIVSLVYLSYTSLMPAILKFPTELNVIKKEQFNNWYKLKTYYLAFLFVNIPMQMLFTVVYAIFAYYLSSQVLVYWRFLKFLLVCMLTTLINEGFGLFLGTSLSPVNGVFMGAVLICFFILFAGYVVLFAHMPRLLYYVSYSSYFRYAFEALVQSVYGNNREILKCPIEETYCHYRYPQKIFEELGMDETRYVKDVLMLFFFLVLFFVMSFFSLRHNIRKG
ncbi:ATP-binding cassette sub-family G member 1-like [Planococcus citri]|uniref:ATP-binding cassette sub-family G member 1-like n=1 Tax=Planococcus citri TaxID=170843 RepID=UPI0031F850A5